MISRRFSAWQKVVALAPLLLFAVYLPGQAMLRCRFDGLLRQACCCPQERDAQDSGPVIKAQECCDRELSVNERPVFAPAPARSAAVDAAAAASCSLLPASVSLCLADPAGTERAWQAHGPPREGPPIVLLKHAFLI